VSLRDDIRGGLWYAVWFSGIALVIIGVAAIRTVLGARITGWSQLLIALPIILASYFSAGVLGGTTYWATRALRRSSVGWALSGVLIGTIVYGGVGLTGILAYVYLGVNAFEFASEAEAWHLWPWISLIAGTCTGIPLGLYYWSQERSGGQTETNWRFIAFAITIGAILAGAMWLAGWW
jgi:hypothetical protein